MDHLTRTTKEAIAIRGMFMHRYSGVEFAVSELIVRARQHHHYNELGDLPRSFDKKLRRIQTLIDREGPLKNYNTDVSGWLKRFTELEEVGHFMAHGLMTIIKNESDKYLARFSMYDFRKDAEQAQKNSVLHQGQFEIEMLEFKLIVDEIQPISTNFTALVAQICREVPLPHL